MSNAHLTPTNTQPLMSTPKLLTLNSGILSSAFYMLYSIFCTSCQTPTKDSLPLDPVAYQDEITVWHQQRIENLKSETGWLNLAGLFWLQEGINTFGSDPANALVFPENKIAARAGFFLVKNGVVRVNVNPEVEIFANDQRVRELGIFHPDSARNPTLTHGSLQWFVIKRDNQLGIRVRDLESPEVESFTGIDRYPVDPAWRVQAQLKVPASPKQIDITNVLGQTTPQHSPGTLVFELFGKAYQLDALQEGSELFIIFGDSTNATETYPAGRYLYATLPEAEGWTILDFNKAYNPPCAFTPYATCPLPPAQNVLPLAIRAGEKNYHGYTH
jgi:uncharacterized protein